MKSGDAAQTISYDFRAGSSDTTAITVWAFASLTSTDTTDTAGIDVEDYSDKPGGTYTKTVTYKAEMMSSGYTAQNGDTITGSYANNTLLVIAQNWTRTPLTS